MRKLIAPTRVLGINRNFIPLKPASVAASWVRIVWLCLETFPKLCCEKMVLVPVLRDSRVRETRKHTAARTRIIGRQNRFPDRKHADVCIRVFLQYFFNCGRPPQTCWSGR